MVQLREPAADDAPPAQLSQLAAFTPEYLPASQSVHESARLREAVPAGHTEQFTARPSL